MTAHPHDVWGPKLFNRGHRLLMREFGKRRGDWFDAPEDALWLHLGHLIERHEGLDIESKHRLEADRAVRQAIHLLLRFFNTRLRHALLGEGPLLIQSDWDATRRIVFQGWNIARAGVATWEWSQFYFELSRNWKRKKEAPEWCQYLREKIIQDCSLSQSFWLVVYGFNALCLMQEQFDKDLWELLLKNVRLKDQSFLIGHGLKLAVLDQRLGHLWLDYAYTYSDHPSPLVRQRLALYIETAMKHDWDQAPLMERCLTALLNDHQLNVRAQAWLVELRRDFSDHHWNNLWHKFPQEARPVQRSLLMALPNFLRTCMISSTPLPPLTPIVQALQKCQLTTASTAQAKAWVWLVENEERFQRYEALRLSWEKSKKRRLKVPWLGGGNDQWLEEGGIWSLIVADDSPVHIRFKGTYYHVKSQYPVRTRAVWRVLHELRHLRPGKRQGVSHCKARQGRSGVWVDSLVLAEEGETLVPGEPVFFCESEDWRPWMPLVADVLQIVRPWGKRWFCSFSPYGRLLLEAPKNWRGRIRAWGVLTWCYGSFSRLRLQGDIHAKPSEWAWVQCLTKLGFQIQWTSYGVESKKGIP